MAKKNAAFRTYIALSSVADGNVHQVNPTLATGDVKVSKDGGAFANVTTLASVVPSGGASVQVDLSSTEMNADLVVVRFHDAAGGEWADFQITIATAARTQNEMDTDLQAILVDTGTTLDGRIPAALGANGNMKSDLRDWLATALATPDTAGYPKVTVKDGTGTGEIDTSSGAVAVSAAAIRAALGLASANLDTQLDALPTAAECAAALLDLSNGIETGLTPRQALRLLAAVAVGVTTGMEGTTGVFKGAGVATTRVQATLDGNNRTAVTLTP